MPSASFFVRNSGHAHWLDHHGSGPAQAEYPPKAALTVQNAGGLALNAGDRGLSAQPVSTAASFPKPTSVPVMASRHLGHLWVGKKKQPPAPSAPVARLAQDTVFCSSHWSSFQESTHIPVLHLHQNTLNEEGANGNAGMLYGVHFII